MITLLKNIWKINDERHFKWVKLVRFAISGGSATALNLISLFVLVHFFNFWYLAGAIIGYSLGFGVSFLLQKFWTFRSSSIENIHIQFIFFSIAGCFGIILNTGLVFLLVEYISFHYFSAQILSGVVIALTNYFLYQEIIFHHKEAERLFNFIKTNKIKIYFVILSFLFLIIRLPGIHLPYHQDEMKTALESIAPDGTKSGLFHPPLTQLFFKSAGKILGPDNLRIFTVIFSFAGVLLLYNILKRRTGQESALMSIVLLSVCTYSVHASLMVDTDGAILPFFFILSLYFYDLWLSESSTKKTIFFTLFAISLILGFLVKLSFIIILGTFVLDFWFENRYKIYKKDYIKIFFGVITFLFLFICVIFSAKFFLPSFSLDGMIAHALSFFNIKDRGYGQIIIQAIKSFFYLSPLVLVPILFIKKGNFSKLRIFIIQIILGSFFYFIIFDFSQGALDKYLMFFIIPLVAISAIVISSLNKEIELSKIKNGLWLGIFVGAGLIYLNFLNHTVFALYPKSIWFENVIKFKWNMLFPLTGGSGPLGFYMSFIFIIFSFLASFFFATLAFFKESFKTTAIVSIFIIGVIYNAVFIEEFLFGKFFGSAPDVLGKSMNFINNSSNIKKVITYNDIGAYELIKLNKYSGRFYAVPDYVENHKKLFVEHRGHFLVINVPVIYSGSFYEEFFKECLISFETKFGKIDGKVYDCTNK